MVGEFVLKEGDKAPDFELKDSFGKTVKLSDFFGKNVVLYFYPRDNTPGCTIEACGFRDDFSVYKKNNIEVLGVSLDDEKSHQKFVEKFGLPFRLLCDVEAVVSKKYGVFGEKSFLGKKFFGLKRSTFLIDKKGVLLRVFWNVKVKGHSKEIIELFKQLREA